MKEYEKILYTTIKNKEDTYEETGQISGSKVSQPTVVAILTMLGIEKKFDDYTLAKFQRGHDVEEKFLEYTFHMDKLADTTNYMWTYNDSVYTWQKEIPHGYRGATCSIDLLEKNKDGYILHEVKSVGKYKYDRVAGKRKGSDGGPDLSHCLQVTLYAKSLRLTKPAKVLIHYVNADDYRVLTFEINPKDYLEELDRRIDAIQECFMTHRLPEYQPYEAWQKGKYNSFPELEGLSEREVNAWVERHYPEEYNKFMNSTWTEKGVIYE